MPDEFQEIEVYEIYFKDITNIDVIIEGDWASDSMYQINSYETDDWIQLLLSTEDDGHNKFINALVERVPQLKQEKSAP